MKSIKTESLASSKILQEFEKKSLKFKPEIRQRPCMKFTPGVCKHVRAETLLDDFACKQEHLESAYLPGA